MSRAFTVIYDACVLHPASVRDLLIRLARTKIFRAGWTEDIEAELARSLAGRATPMTPAQFGRLRENMRGAVPDCLVEGYHPRDAVLYLPQTTLTGLIEGAGKLWLEQKN